MAKHDWKGGPRKGFIKTLVDWSDPELVRDEVTRLANHAREAKERMHRTSIEIENLKKVLADGPARLQKLLESLDEDRQRIDRLDAKRYEAMRLMAGAKIAQQIERLERKLKDEKTELVRLKTGAAPRSKPTARARKREEDPSLDQHADIHDV